MTSSGSKKALAIAPINLLDNISDERSGHAAARGQFDPKVEMEKAALCSQLQCNFF